MNSLPLGRSSSFVLEQTSEFNHLLQTPASFRAFYLFLSREFAIENLLFWQQAQKMREAAEEQQMPSSQLAQLYGARHTALAIT